MVKLTKKFNPKIPMELAMEQLKPVYKDEAQAKLAETNPYLEEQGRRSAYAIWKNGGARNAAELEALKKEGARK